MAEPLQELQRRHDRLARRLERERRARAKAETIAERAIRDLSRSNREYQAFFNLSLNLFCTVDTDLRFREANPAWQELLGWSPGELRGTSLLDRVHPDDVASTREQASSLQQPHQALRGFQQRFRHRDGGFLWLSWSVRQVEGLFYAEARDVTQQKQAEVALQQSEARIRAILNSAVDAILTIDAGGMIRDLNPATEKIFGYRAEEMLGHNVSMLMPKPHREHHDGYIRNYLETAVPKVIGKGREAVALRRDGSTFPIELAVGEVRESDGRLFTGIIRDISARKTAERRLEETLRDLQQSRDDLLTTLDRLRVGTLILDADEHVSFCSQRWDALAWSQSESALGRRWDELLPLDEPGRRAFRSALHTPELQRTRLLMSWRGEQGQALFAEVDIRDDPRDASARIAFFYDVTEVHTLRDQLASASHGCIIGRSQAMQALYAQIARVADGDWTVLIEGETGAGKELVARAVHAASPRSRGPFVAVNCAGLTDTLLESQLFGHRRGAFTGAVADQPGLFEAAHGGTLLLDEIGDISTKLQASLLRVLQEREFMRVGDTKMRRVDVRILAATHRDLQRELGAGRFRQDLLYRLRNARLRVPALRERAEDIVLLASAFLDEQRQRCGKPLLEFAPSALHALQQHSWPGNVRELRAAIEHAVIHCQTRQIGVADLPPELHASAAAGPPPFEPATAWPVAPAPPAPPPPPQVPAAPFPAEPALPAPGEDPRTAILAALEWAEGNRARAARKLGISRGTLYRRLRELGLPNKRG